MRAAARLSHVNIVTAYSSPPLEGLLAFAMEYVDGTDLHELVVARGPLPVPNTCNYVYQAAKGLRHAHDRQMVHRDIKPNNLMLTRDGKKQLIKILDFGLAKATSENAIGAGLTGTGQMLGTPMYMAPEQIVSAAKADIRADIYGLGCTLYYLLTGHPPFQGKESLYAILYAHLSEIARPLHELRPDVPAELSEIVARMMAKDAAQRYQQPGEVAQALSPFFKQGIKPIPAGTARFPAPSMGPAPHETASSKASEATSLPSSSAAPVPAVPAPNPASPPSGTRPAEPNPMPTMLEVVNAPARSHAVEHLATVQTPRIPVAVGKLPRAKRSLAAVAAVLIVGLLTAWAGGLFRDGKQKMPIPQAPEPLESLFVPGSVWKGILEIRDGKRTGLLNIYVLERASHTFTAIHRLDGYYQNKPVRVLRRVQGTVT